jgi:hypothetical protein
MRSVFEVQPLYCIRITKMAHQQMVRVTEIDVIEQLNLSYRSVGNYHEFVVSMG